MEESLEDTHCAAKTDHTCLLAVQNRKGSKRFPRLTSRQQYTIEQGAIRFKPDLNPEERYLPKHVEFAKILPQHNLRNTVEQDPCRQRTTTNLSTRHDRDHNQTQWNPQVPQTRGNTRANL